MPQDDKLDLYKEHKDEYAAKKKPLIIQMKKATYLAVEGSGAPGSPVFEEKIGALYSMAFTTKMTWKFAGKQDYKVCKLEGQYWGEESSLDFSEVPKEEWRWRLMIRTPTFIKEKHLAESRETLHKRNKGTGTEEVQLFDLSEGRCCQMLHVGPYEKEPETIEIMREFAHSEGWEFHGIHHEIYLSDPRRVPPERLKTILRLPVKKR